MSSGQMCPSHMSHGKMSPTQMSPSHMSPKCPLVSYLFPGKVSPSQVVRCCLFTTLVSPSQASPWQSLSPVSILHIPWSVRSPLDSRLVPISQSGVSMSVVRCLHVSSQVSFTQSGFSKSGVLCKCCTAHLWHLLIERFPWNLENAWNFSTFLQQLKLLLN